jgi:hypothetical protein
MLDQSLITLHEAFIYDWFARTGCVCRWWEANHKACIKSTRWTGVSPLLMSSITPSPQDSLAINALIAAVAGPSCEAAMRIVKVELRTE